MIEISNTLNTMILSASGWRGIFAADGNEESKTGLISDAHKIIAAGAAHVFAGFLRGQTGKGAGQTGAGLLKTAQPLVLVGTDTRPTGRAISLAVIQALVSSGCAVKWAGFVAAPEIMAWAQHLGATEKQGTQQRLRTPIGFIYISASHNPVGHNGLKFGLTDGGVLAPDKSAALIGAFKDLMAKADCPAQMEGLLSAANAGQLNEIIAGEATSKEDALKAYIDFINIVVWDVKGCDSSAAPPALAALKASLAKNPLGLVCDFNGSARSVSIDRKFFDSVGINFRAINDRAGEIAHRIVPEGESLEPCMEFLEENHKADSSFVMGYTPDCDGDRGNLVIWDEGHGRARILEAQEVFALACVAELSQLVWAGELAYDSAGKALTKAALVANDPTSLRIDRIAEAFKISVFRAETGEANVVGLARKLRESGYMVRILGEGPAGGNITHPQAVRDPLNTVLALAKLLSIRSSNDKPGLFELWCSLSRQPAQYRENFTLADVINSLPPFISTGAYEERAILRIKTLDHSLLKEKYQRIFLREWDNLKDSLRTKYGIYKYEASAYNGIEEKRGLNHFADAGKGGLKICFLNHDDRSIASIWMRGSATEPVFRIMADIEGRNKHMEQELIEWQGRMVKEADAE